MEGENVFNSKWTWLAIGVGLGFVLAPKLRTLPLVSKLPSL